MLDSSAAFDCVDHNILLNRLEVDYGLGKEALQLIKSYLYQRTFSINLEGYESEPRISEFGVPQGSILGPFIYTLYTKYLEEIAFKNGLRINMYADDCIIYFSFDNNNLAAAEKNANNCLSEIKLWMNQNFLKLNTLKTQLKIYKPNMSKPLNFCLNYNNCLISPTNFVNILGVRVGEIFNNKSFINKKIQVCNFHLKNLSNIRDALPHKARVIMITNLILTNLDYCNSILLGTNNNELKPLQLIINKSVRFIFNINKRTHITPFLKKLHILPVIYRIKYKVCLISYRILNGTAPSYLVEKFPTFTPTTTTSLREGRGRDRMMFAMKRPVHGKETTNDRIKKEWNNLPIKLRAEESINIFKSRLKAHFFSQAFDSV